MRTFGSALTLVVCLAAFAIDARESTPRIVNGTVTVPTLASLRLRRPGG